MAETELTDEKRVQFGQRFLTDGGLVFEHNAWFTRWKHVRPPLGGRSLPHISQAFDFNNWDNVEWDADQEAEAINKVANNSAIKASQPDQDKYEKDAAAFWDEFYNQHDNKFFKDRHWLFTEFPELSYSNRGSSDISNAVNTHSNELNAHGNIAKTHKNDSSIVCNDVTHFNNTNANDSEIDHEKRCTVNSEGVDNTFSSPLKCLDEQSPQRTSSSLPLSPNSSSHSPSSSSYPGQSSTTRILEVGCGVGNTIFPLLETNNDPGLYVYGCDLSAKAIDIIKESSNYDPSRCHVFVSDVSSPDSPSFPFLTESLDFIILIFVLSAIKPDKMIPTLQRLLTYLKPGGMLLFRDYGRYDMAQLRFKKGRCLEENFYVRGDGTRVYFFTQEELKGMFEGLGLQEEQNYVDRRLQVNRGRQLKMFRVWMQCKYSKPL